VTIIYGCDHDGCTCEAYERSAAEDAGGVLEWPRCKCGHIAQDHNCIVAPIPDGWTPPPEWWH
jgi:hypothetical protein